MPPSMDALQITFKVKKGRRSVVAVVGRGSRRVEMGTGLRVPDGANFEAPRNISGGHHRTRNDFIAALNEWEVNLRERWLRLQSLKLEAKPSDLLETGSSAVEIPHRRGLQRPALSVAVNYLAEQVRTRALVNDRTGGLLSRKTLEFNGYFVGVVSRYILSHGDFDLGAEDRASRLMRFKKFGVMVKRFLLEESQFGLETTFKLMERLRWLLRSYSTLCCDEVDEALLSALKFPKPRKNNNEDVFSLDVDQYEWILENEANLRAKHPSAPSQAAIDYLVVGLVTCARKGDIDSWTTANLRSTSRVTTLRYVPKKTESSSNLTVDFMPLPDSVLRIFERNIDVHGKLLPPLFARLGGSIRRILREEAIMQREVAVRDSTGGYKKTQSWEALRIHSLRSSGITYLLSRGVPEVIVRSISGHTRTSESFAAYSKVLESVKFQKLQETFSN
jgi:hypothetical protein